MNLASTGVLNSLVYVSSAVKPFSQDELRALLDTSRRNNSRTGVTGMLVYKSGNFMQALEGEEEAIHDLHAKISRDKRHCGLVTLINQPIGRREFADWSMGFRDLSDSDVHTATGYSEFLNTPLTGNEFAADPARAKKLLLSFKKNM